MKIEKVESWICDTPISHPIDLGRFMVRQRSYLAVRVHTSDGLTGDCITQSRGAPLDVIVNDVLAPRILGKDARDIAALQTDIERELTALDIYGSNGRAWSAVEICLQSLRAQACGWPLWRLLGGSPRAVPALLVEGYAIEGEPEDKFVDRLVERVEQGFSMLKIEAGHFVDDRILLGQLEQFRARAGEAPRIVLDMAWGWSEFKSKMPTLRALEQMGIAWIEDPFASNRVATYRDLRQSTNVAIGGGDETSMIDNMFALLQADALDVLRLDATTMGGMEKIRALSVEAARRGVRVAYHVHPEVHENLVFGLGIADHVEMFPTDRQFDRMHDLLTHASYDRVRDGKIAPSEEPGNGLTIDVDKIAPFVKRYNCATLN